jgi:dTDP-4-amino-4,6-dideoxygalactose transaminase
VDALLRADLTLEYYRILPDLSPDLEQLAKLCEKPVKALFLIHYFGFPQPIAALSEFVREYRLLLIEDNTHGLYSADANGVPLGSLGDMSVFSMRKQLPIPDGGALVLRDHGMGGEIASPVTEDPGYREVARSFAGLVKREIGERYPAIRRIRKTMRSWGSAPNEPISKERITFDAERAAWRISSISRFMLRWTDHHAVRERRIRNFELLETQFEGGVRVRPVKRPAPKGSCPWFYPIWAEDPEALERYLWANRVACHRFWWLFGHPHTPIEDFPFEQLLKYHVMGLPLHQDLGEADMIRVADTLNRWNRR